MKFADRFTAMMATWTFVIIFLVLCALEILWNHTPAVHLRHWDFDPTTIILNLVLSLVAGVQGPVVMISQKRQEKYLVGMVEAILKMAESGQTHHDKEVEFRQKMVKTLNLHSKALEELVKEAENDEKENESG